MSAIESPVILEIVSLSRPKPIAFLAFAKAFSLEPCSIPCSIPFSIPCSIPFSIPFSIPSSMPAL